MVLNKVKNNMYDWITKTRNYLGGECKHKCAYCYVNRMKEKFLNLKERYSGNIRLLDKELSKNEGTGETIFVQDMGDLFAENVPTEFVLAILAHCKNYPNNTYIFQTKNPTRFIEFINYFPNSSYLGITLETNRGGFNYNAPPIAERIKEFSRKEFKRFNKFLTIEPIMEFDLEEFVEMIRKINPEFVNIGADSNYKKNYIFPEPSKEKILKLIDSLKCFTEVHLKPNLQRLLEVK